MAAGNTTILPPTPSHTAARWKPAAGFPNRGIDDIRVPPAINGHGIPPMAAGLRGFHYVAVWTAGTTAAASWA